MKITFTTDGKGLWTEKRKDVTITDMRIGYMNREKEFGELEVYFDTKTWDTSKDGLIYTDKLFLSDLRNFLDEHNLPAHDVSYSEQGMQRSNYVSLDIGKQFISAWTAKFG